MSDPVFNPNSLSVKQIGKNFHHFSAKERLESIRNTIEEGRCYELDAKAILINHVLSRLITQDQSFGIDQMLEGKGMKEKEEADGVTYLKCVCHGHGIPACNQRLRLLKTGFGK